MLNANEFLEMYLVLYEFLKDINCMDRRVPNDSVAETPNYARHSH